MFNWSWPLKYLIIVINQPCGAIRREELSENPHFVPTPAFRPSYYGIFLSPGPNLPSSMAHFDSVYTWWCIMISWDSTHGCFYWFPFDLSFNFRRFYSELWLPLWGPSLLVYLSCVRVTTQILWTGPLEDCSFLGDARQLLNRSILRGSSYVC